MGTTEIPYRVSKEDKAELVITTLMGIELHRQILDSKERVVELDTRPLPGGTFYRSLHVNGTPHAGKLMTVIK